MQLLDRYLQAVRRSLFFMSSAHKDDIIRELGEDLRSQMEEREAESGRPPDEAEQEVILRRCGHPALVASRYRGGRGALTFGPVLIGPDIFPYYLLILCLNVAVTIGLFLLADIMALIGGTPVSRVMYWTVMWPGLALPVLTQLVVVTVGFIGVEVWKRRWMSHLGVVRSQPPAPPRGQTILGIVIWSIAALWWAFVPLWPALLFASMAGSLQLGPAWIALFAPIELLLLAGIAQRVVSIQRPDLTLFHAGVRLLANTLGLVFLYAVRTSQVFVTVAVGAQDPLRAEHLAQSFNAVIVWGILSWIWIYLGSNLLGNASVTIKCLRRWLSGRRSAAPHARGRVPL